MLFWESGSQFTSMGEVKKGEERKKGDRVEFWSTDRIVTQLAIGKRPFFYNHEIYLDGGCIFAKIGGKYEPISTFWIWIQFYICKDIVLYILFIGTCNKRGLWVSTKPDKRQQLQSKFSLLVVQERLNFSREKRGKSLRSCQQHIDHNNQTWLEARHRLIFTRINVSEINVAL